jgi:Zn-dependent oligopeptidase
MANYHSCLLEIQKKQYLSARTKAYQAIAASDDYALLDTAQKKIIQNALRSFRLSGVDLDAEKKARYKEISLEA